MMLDAYLSDALRLIRIARANYMQFSTDDENNVDYIAEKFNDALTVVENLKEEARS